MTRMIENIKKRSNDLYRAGEEHLKLLKEEYKLHNLYEISPSAGLSRAYLREVDFSREDLSRANFDFAFLKKANLRDSNLSEANLENACLEAADLRGTDLSSTSLDKAI